MRRCLPCPPCLAACYYILDEVGARLCPAELEDAGFRCAVFYDQSQEMAYSLLWPIRDIAEEEAATAVGLPLAVRKRFVHGLPTVVRPMNSVT